MLLLKLYLQKNLAHILLIGSTVMMLGTLAAAHHAMKWQQHQKAIRATQKVALPLGVPTVSQESIDTALKTFQIDIPKGVVRPVIDRNLQDRAITVVDALNASVGVFVGPGAFSSWSVLGSTLAHELEVHCEQNFTMIRFLDIVGLKGTNVAERQAYQHEIIHARRFGLTRDEIAGINETMNFYYPRDNFGQSITGLIKGSVQKFLARTTWDTIEKPSLKD